jgi:hypothetical protein
MFAVRRINDSSRLAFPHDLHFEDLHLEDPEDRRTAIPFFSNASLVCIPGVDSLDLQGSG